MLAILIYWRLTETEQTKNNSSLSRRQSGGNHGPGQTKRLAAKARCGVPVPSRAPATTAYGRQRDCELPAAKALGITVPLPLSGRADDVIE